MAAHFKLDLPRLTHGRRCGRGRRLGIAFIAAAVAIGARGAEKRAEWTRPPPDFKQTAPTAEVRAAAETAGIKLEPMAGLVERDGLQPGDGLIALVTLTDGAELKQWVILLETVLPTEKERKLPERRMRFFSGTGYEFRFGSSRAALELRVLGPFAKGSRRSDSKNQRVVVSADYLALGLDRMPAAMERVRAAMANNPALPRGGLEFAERPFPPSQHAASRKAAESVGLMEADERAAAGTAVALIEFFQIAMRTPGLQEVLKSVLDVPWWSIVSSGGKMPGIGFDGLRFSKKLSVSPWGLPASVEVYASPWLLRLNGEPALLFQLAVTRPRPPLLVSAGIVGFAAGRPDGKGPTLTLQIVSGHTATPKTEP